MIVFHSGHRGSPPGFCGAAFVAAFARGGGGGITEAKRGPKSACATLPLLSVSRRSNHAAAAAENSAFDSFMSALLSPCLTSAAASGVPGPGKPPHDPWYESVAA